jgi:hypothetical protein
MRQAYATSGLSRAQTRRIRGVHHTLTVWESETAMRAYLVTGAHLCAMKAAHRLATWRTVTNDVHSKHRKVVYCGGFTCIARCLGAKTRRILKALGGKICVNHHLPPNYLG